MPEGHRNILLAAWRASATPTGGAALAAPTAGGNEPLAASAVEAAVATAVKESPTRANDLQAVGQLAIVEGWDRNRLELELVRTKRPSGGFLHARPGGFAETGPAVLASACLTLLGRDDIAAAEFGDAAAQRARDLRCRTALDLCDLVLRASGVTPPRDRVELASMALDIRAGGPSTYSLPTLLGDSASKLLLAAYRESPATWRSFAAVRSVDSFHTHTGIRPSAGSTLDKVAPGGEVRHGTLGEETYSYSADTFAKLLSVDRRDLVNDSLGFFAEATAVMGKSAARSLNDQVYSTFLAAKATFFTSGRSNTQTGGGSALSATSLGTAIKQMMAQRDAAGNDLDITPMVLAVPPELRQVAIGLMESEYLSRVATGDALPTGNPERQTLELQIEPRLSNTTKFSGASTTAWYVMGSPQDAPMVVAFLNDRQAPVVEFFGIENDRKRLAATWRVFWDYGASTGDYRAAQHSAGA
jgi:hypothetical protein